VETENRLATAGLNQQLRSVRGYSFFQLANLLRRFSALHNMIEEVPVEVRYRAMPSLAFPAADIDHCELHPAGYRQFLDVTVTFMGLFGPASPLPAFYTERVIQSLDQKSPSRDLMDVFNHRYISLLQTCWDKYRYYTQYQPDGSDQYTQWLLSLLGIDPQTLPMVSTLRWHKLLPFVGVLLNNVCSADLLCKIVAAYFDLKAVSVQPWSKREISIAQDQCNRIGQMNSQMGDDLVLGATMVDVSGKFALQFADLSPLQYRAFLPDGSWFHELIDLVRFALKDPLDFDLHLACSEHGDGCALGGDEFRIGWNYQLGSRVTDESPAMTVICVADTQIV